MTKMVADKNVTELIIMHVRINNKNTGTDNAFSIISLSVLVFASLKPYVAKIAV